MVPLRNIRTLFGRNLDFITRRAYSSVADSGFPIGDVDPLGGGVDLRHGRFLAKMYAKTKELGPIGGMHPARPPDPPMLLTTNYSGLGPYHTHFHIFPQVALIRVWNQLMIFSRSRKFLTLYFF